MLLPVYLSTKKQLLAELKRKIVVELVGILTRKPLPFSAPDFFGELVIRLFMARYNPLASV